MNRLQAQVIDQTKSANMVCHLLFQDNPGLNSQNYETYFDSKFRSQLSLDELLSDISEIEKTVGPCIQFRVTPQSTSGQYEIQLSTAQEYRVSLLIGVDSSSSLVTGLRISSVDDPSVVIQSWDDVRKALIRLNQGSGSGKLGATLKTADSKIGLTAGADQVFAIGSTFKLYILGALQKAITAGLHQWDEKIAIQEQWKSLPSGEMQNLPDGTQASLLDFATNMISISDNTAADHLLYFLGREAVESMLTVEGNSHASLNTPLMSTLEMFKLKWALKPEQTLEYIHSDPETKRADLMMLSQIDRNSIGTNGVSLEQPTDVSTLEWFASPDDNCNAMFWLASQNSAEIRSILSKNVPLVSDIGQPSGHWAYVGYKGGSEPGVLSMTFLLESKSGTRGCLSMSWNDDQKPVSEALFMDVVRKTLSIAEQQIL